MSENSRGYFAARESEECVSALFAKIEHWSDTLTATGYLNKLKDMYSAYHGAYYSSVGESHQITFGGDDEELVELAVNHFRNLASHILTMTTASRPAMECRAINTDHKSLVQTELGNGLLDYYMRQKKLEEYFKEACEYAIAMAGGYIKLSWNAMLGQVSNQKEIDRIESENDIALEQGLPLKQVPDVEYEGDIECCTLSQLDVILDTTKEGKDHAWKICRSYKNRYDLIAKYPELENEILAISTKSDIDRVQFGMANDDETDDIPIYEFYHTRTESLPNGRYIFFASSEAIFYDGDLPYRNIPVYPIHSGKILGTPFGYSSLFDILPIQDAMNSLYSTILSNQSAFGVQNILVPTGCNIDVNQISGALNVIDYNSQAGKPESLNLTNTPKEIFEFLGMLNQLIETISGISSVVRGNPEANLRSGSAIAMIQSNAIQFMSGLQASYTGLIESVGLGIIEILQDFADSPRIATIVGKSGASYLKQFKGEDLRSINRVNVDSANPMTKTISGRIQMADNLLQYQLLKDPEQYINVINTGKLEVGTEETTKELNLIKQENEMFLDSIAPIAIYTDTHIKHINSHRSVLNDPIMRQQPELIKIVLAHIQEHINLLKTTDPSILQALGQQPILPPQPTAMPPQQGGQTIPPNINALPPQEQAAQAQDAVPQNVRLPEGFEEAPLTPEQNLENNGRRG